MSDQTLLEGLLARCADLLATNVQLQQDIGAQLVNGAGPTQDLRGYQKRLVHLQRQLTERTLDPIHAVADIQQMEEWVTIQAAIIHERREEAEALAARMGITSAQALPLFVIGKHLRRYQANVGDLIPTLQPLVQTIIEQCQMVLDDVLSHDGTRTLGDLYAAWDAVLDAFASTYENNAVYADGGAEAEQETVKGDLRDVVTLLDTLAQRLETQRAPEALIAGCWTIQHEGHSLLNAYATTDLLTIRDYLARLQTMYAHGIAWLNPHR